MFKRNKIENPHIKISICRDVLESIFDECDKCELDETGGRILGFYRHEDTMLNVDVRGLIGPGPNARRSPTSFYQDGEYQETVFRKIESENPNVEHLGNWHTHHVNGLDTLSSGDLATYRRIVNHEKHNTDFFYALLVVAKNQSHRKGDRYAVKHFVFKRGESLAYEIPSSQIKIVNNTPIFIDKERLNEGKKISAPLSRNDPITNEIRSMDQKIIPIMYPNIKPFFSKGTNSLYWKGKLSLIDNTSVELLMLESAGSKTPSYSVTLAGSETDSFRSKQTYLERTFDTGWKAIYSFERDLNLEIFEALRKGRDSNLGRNLE
jgi:hypothetical protein